MCELFGMSANVPTDICFSFAGMMRRGGETGPHRDGWGVAFYEDKGCRTFHDPRASAESEIARLVRSHAIHSETVICHIRKATHGRVCLENTHPFTRELWGRHWAFAHNGKLRGIKKRPLGHFRPVGTTDSEHAFCWLLDQLRQRYPGPRPPSGSLEQDIREMAADLDRLMENFFLQDLLQLEFEFDLVNVVAARQQGAAKEELGEDASDRPNVDGGPVRHGQQELRGLVPVDRSRSAGQCKARCVVVSAQRWLMWRVPQGGDGGGVGSNAVVLARLAEVGELDDRATHQDVFWLDVTVHVASRVHRRHRLHDLPPVHQCEPHRSAAVPSMVCVSYGSHDVRKAARVVVGALWQLDLVEVVEQRPVHALVHEEQDAVLAHDPQQLDQVWVVQRLQDLHHMHSTWTAIGRECKCAG